MNEVGLYLYLCFCKYLLFDYCSKLDLNILTIEYSYNYGLSFIRIVCYCCCFVVIFYLCFLLIIYMLINRLEYM